LEPDPNIPANISKVNMAIPEVKTAVLSIFFNIPYIEYILDMTDGIGGGFVRFNNTRVFVIRWGIEFCRTTPLFKKDNAVLARLEKRTIGWVIKEVREVDLTNEELAALKKIYAKQQEEIKTDY